MVCLSKKTVPHYNNMYTNLLELAILELVCHLVYDLQILYIVNPSISDVSQNICT